MTYSLFISIHISGKTPLVYPSSGIIPPISRSLPIAFILTHNPRPKATLDRTCESPILIRSFPPIGTLRLNYNPTIGFFPLIHHKLTSSFDGIHLHLPDRTHIPLSTIDDLCIELCAYHT
jgi:hypothetical protein